MVTLIFQSADGAELCVPADWTQREIKNYADSNFPSDTQGGWRHRAPDADSRVICSAIKHHVHILLDR